MRIGRRRIRVGEMMMWFRRLQAYLAIPSSMLGTVAFFKILGISYWWLLSLIPICAVVVLVDVLWIGPGEFQSATNRNPEWERFIKEDINAIKKSLKI